MFVHCTSNCSKDLHSASLSAGTSTTPTQLHPSTKHPSQPPTAQEPVSLDQLVKRLQEHVLSNRIRVSEHFQDFDPLRSGSISAAKFRQVRDDCVIMWTMYMCMLSPSLDFLLIIGGGTHRALGLKPPPPPPPIFMTTNGPI